MSAKNVKSVWSVLEKVLARLDFSQESIEKVKVDLENLTETEVITQLLENLTEDNKAKLKSLIISKEGVEKESTIKEFLNNIYSKDEINQYAFQASQTVLKDCLDYLFRKAEGAQKKQILSDLMVKQG